MSTWKELNIEAKKSLRSNDLLQARLYIEDALQLAPTEPQILNTAVSIYSKSNEHEIALRYANKLIEIQTNQYKGFLFAGKSLTALQRYEEAEEVIKLGLKKSPNQKNLISLLSALSRKSGKVEKALEYSKKLIEMSPENVGNYGQAARDLCSLERFEEAQKQINDGLSHFPNNRYLLTIASDIYRNSGQYKEALQFSEQLAEKYPEELKGYTRVVQNLISLELYEKAKATISNSKAKFPNHPELIKIDKLIDRLMTAETKSADTKQKTSNKNIFQRIYKILSTVRK